jgi:glycosyltransferase involved in cell wall biosynthesis
MPMHNAGVHLEPAVRSILDQSFSDFEFIVVDDASTDGSDRVLASFGDPRIRVVRSETNLGVVGALNLGLGFCRGRYVARMDADDLSHPDRLATQVAFMEANPGIALCGTDIEILCELETDRRTTSWVVTGGSELLRFRMLFDNPFCHPTVMMRAALLRRHAFRYEAHALHAEEFDLWRRISEVAGIANLNRCLLTYRIHDLQVSQIHAARQAATVARMKRMARRDLLTAQPPFDDRIAPLVFNAAWCEPEPGWREVRRVLQVIPEFGGMRAVLELCCWSACARTFLLLARHRPNRPYARFLTRITVHAIIRSLEIVLQRILRRDKRAAAAS